MIEITCKGECQLPLTQGMNRVLSNFVPCFHFVLSENKKERRFEKACFQIKINTKR